MTKSVAKYLYGLACVIGLDTKVLADTTLFSSTDVPAVSSDYDAASVELGVKFTPSVSGAITGFRYYKGRNDTGTHSAHLWNSSGNLLQTVTFVSETTSGWQQVNLATPYTISAGKTYIASYFSHGHYADTNNYFTSPHVSADGMLTAPSGGNGVYAYGSSSVFPTNTWFASNYWVDVVFSASPPPPPPPPPPSSGSGASWLSESSFVASTQETGRIGYLEAWGGGEYGYAYTYSLSGQPSALVVDSNTGMLTLGSSLATGTYNFTATVTNRKNTTLVSTFPITLTISSNIQVKTYVVESGLYGLPNGHDYTTVLMKLRSVVLADQAAAGEETLRAIIVFHAGNIYQYTNNRWMYGIQYLTIKTDSPGIRAQLQDINPGDGSDISFAVLQLGRPYFSCDTTTTSVCGFNKPNTMGYLINTNSVGDTSVTLQSASDASNLRVGRYVMVGSFDQQGTGWPPNVRYHEYARITGINGATVSLDRQLRFSHRGNYYEGSDSNSLGRARIYAIDRDDVRMTLRATVRDITFLSNPSTTRDVGTMVYSGTLDASWENDLIPDMVPSQERFIRIVGTTVSPGGIDFDKDMSMAIVDSSTASIYEGTSLDYLLITNSSSILSNYYGIAPRQLRIINSTLTGQGGYSPFTIICWGTQSIDMIGAKLISNLPPIGAWPGTTVTIGSGGTWNANTLTVAALGPVNEWINAVWEGAIVYNGTGRTTSWGYITKVYGDTTNIYADITWVAGTKPVNGQTLYLPRLHEISVDTTSSTNTTWSSMHDDEGRHGFPTGTRQFPVGYPGAQYGFP